MKRFDYLAPGSLDEAADMLGQYPAALPLAGGTDLLVQMKEGQRPVRALLSLKRVREMHHLAFDNGVLHLGAAVKARAVERDPAIREAFPALAVGAGLIGSIQIRNMATVGGNVCNGSPAADTAPPLLALGAEAVIASAGGERVAPLESFWLGPGRTVLQPGELLREIRVPRLPGRSGSYYYRHTPRAWMDIAFVGVAAVLTLGADGTITDARLALGAVAPTPIRATEAEKALIGAAPGEEVFAQAGQIAAREARPIDDLRASAEYRRHIVSVLARRALQAALDRAIR